MARSARSSTLETRTARLKLPVSKKPVFVKIGPGVELGYRRKRTAGIWVACVADDRGGNWTKEIGRADDFDEADGSDVLDFWQAQEKALTLGRAEHEQTGAWIASHLDGMAGRGALQAAVGSWVFNTVAARKKLSPSHADAMRRLEADIQVTLQQLQDVLLVVAGHSAAEAVEIEQRVARLLNAASWISHLHAAPTPNSFEAARLQLEKIQAELARTGKKEKRAAREADTIRVAYDVFADLLAAGELLEHGAGKRAHTMITG